MMNKKSRPPRAHFTVPRLMIAAILTALAASGRTSSQSVQTADGSDEPMTVAASCVGRFAKGRSWYLSVNSAGEAELTILTRPEPTRRRFVVPRQQLTDLRKAINEERFFGLGDEFGERVADSSKTTVTIVVGERAKSVRLRYLMNWVHGDHAKLREPSRAVRISAMIRSWFDDAEAVDLRRYDRMVLDAAKE